MSKNKLLPNYGWVQNTSNLVTIRKTLLLVPEYGIKHLELRDKIKAYRKKRNELPKRWDWDARCRIKAIHALGLVNLNRNIQGYDLTSLGKALKDLSNQEEKLSDAELEIFKIGLLTNSPVIRVLTLLLDDKNDKDIGLSKYDIGAQLGFVGDIGFTHLDPYWVALNGLSFNNKEGDADKWARTILSWLQHVGWIYESGEKLIYGKKLPLYKVTKEVQRILRYDINRIIRNVPIEMLCSARHPFRNLIQKRRSIILKSLSQKTPKLKTHLIAELIKNDIEANDNVIEFELVNLRQAGFRISENGGYFKLTDKIKLDVPAITNVIQDENVIEKMIEENVVKYEDTIPPKLIDHLIRYGYSDKFSEKFESVISEYFRFLGYDIEGLGYGKGRVADMLAKYNHPNIYAKSYALIIDVKATTKSYNFPASDIRKMKEYIKTHGPELAKQTILHHAFSFISSQFNSNMEKALREISQETHVNGCCIKILELIKLGDKIRNQNVSIENLFPLYTTNAEFVI